MRRFLWILPACLALGLLGWWASIPPKAKQPHRLVLTMAPPEQWSGLTELQQRGLMTLLKDVLETDGTFTIGMAETMGNMLRNTPTLQVAARREGDALAIQPRWLGHQGDPVHPHQGVPADVLGALCAEVHVVPTSLPRLIPARAAVFWDTLEASGWGGDKDLHHCLALSRRLAEANPDLASAWCAFGQQSFRQLSLDPRLGSDAQEASEQRFRRALELIPGYPRAAYQFANLKTDSARQREGLDVLFEALALRPHAAFLYSGLAYASRTSGLLEGSQRALKRREALLGPMRFESGLTENTYLYCGEWERFSLTLGEDDQAPWRSMRDFYRGYIRLIMGRSHDAVVFFRRSYQQGGASIQFEHLAEVYALQLEGHSVEAKAKLDLLCVDRAKLREPDGEFTFKLAEAYAYLGDIDNAEDMALRAFSQGFSCARWYRESPMLKSMQHLPRYQSLLQHLDEHQAALSARYPAARFG